MDDDESDDARDALFGEYADVGTARQVTPRPTWEEESADWSWWDKVKGGATAATLGTAGAAGALLPWGAKPSDIDTIYANAFRLGAQGHFYGGDLPWLEDGDKRTWASMPDDLADIATRPARRAASDAWEGFKDVADDAKEGLGDILKPAALLAVALALVVAGRG